MRISKYTYNCGIAAYPKYFHGFVVSPTKICIQFSSPQLILRTLGKDQPGLYKLPNTDKVLPVSIMGTDIDVLAVGCQMPTIEALQHQLIDAYKEYKTKHTDIYKETYEKDFTQFIKQVIERLQKEVLTDQSTETDQWI